MIPFDCCHPDFGADTLLVYLTCELFEAPFHYVFALYFGAGKHDLKLFFLYLVYCSVDYDAFRFMLPYLYGLCGSIRPPYTHLLTLIEPSVHIYRSIWVRTHPHRYYLG